MTNSKDTDIMKNPTKSKSKVIIIPNPPQNASKQEEAVQNNVPVEAAPAPAQAPAQKPPVQAEVAEESEE
jgi:hypothetical protein